MSFYPEELERPGLLRDGRSIFIRPAVPEDLDTVMDFYGRLSRRTVAFRSLGPVMTMKRETTRKLVDSDYDSKLVLLATLDDEVIGMADYAVSITERDRAEIGFTVQDSYQGMGLGGLLLEHLAAAGRARGIEVFEADVLDENLPMLRTFQSSGYRVEFGEVGDVRHVELAVDPRRQVLARSDRRERVAIQSSLHPLFAPRSVAVVGASRNEHTVGNAILRNLLNSFRGPLYAVNPHASEIDGVRAVASVRDLADLDLAVVAVPVDAVLEVLADCASIDVGAVIVVSTEMGDAEARTSELLRFVRGHGMRLVGPNCMGVVSLREDADIIATFSPAIPPRGRVSMASQSGPLGLAVLDHARLLGLGFCGFVSLGDSLDISPNDLLHWWETDRATGVVLLHLDAFGNPRRFARTARRLAMKKPVIAVHPGSFRTKQIGALARTSGATGSDATLNALFTQIGVIRTRTMQEMFDTALLLANQPVPAGPRTAILTNAEGPGALAAGACRAAGLVLADLSPETIDVLGRAIRHPVTNPLDLTPKASGYDYGYALRALLDDHGVDAVIVLFIPPLVEDAGPIAQSLVRECVAAPKKPVLASFLSQEGIVADLRIGNDKAIPSYRFPESAATALGHAAAYGNWLRLPVGIVRMPTNMKIEQAKKQVDEYGSGELDDEQSRKLLESFGIRLSNEDTAGQDLTIRVLDDAIFGPVLSVSPADQYAQFFGDVAYGVSPLTDRDAEAMVRSLKSYPVLSGATDRPPVDLDAVIETLLRISNMVDAIPELATLTARRVRVGVPGDGLHFFDATITLSPPSATRLTREAAVENG
ncbi:MULTISPECIES: GNAT family N-acetyltransferase [Actinomycetes]|uniref:bifunctional acetate--CoA ligase family protein/GNAT family N-acetyltransferase n=1 Tax=Actinomycetes TaxID=1760 RepID=UPI0004BF48AB|nr:MULTISPECIES: GNAT family N-acetyltransferase [Actinomycetes]